MPVWVLGLTAIFAFWRVNVVLDDPHHGEVKNAYDTAQQWDSHSALVKASAAMNVGFEFISINQSGEVTARVQKNGVAEIELKGFHNAFPSDVRTTTLRVGDDGLLRGNIKDVRSGAWQFDLSASVNGQPWILHLRSVAPLK